MITMLQSSLLISTLLAYSAKQIGTTYGDFSSTQETEGYFQTCRVFPAHIEELLATVSGHLDQANTARQRIAPVTVTIEVYGDRPQSYDQPAAISSVTDNVYGEAVSSSSVTAEVYGSGGGQWAAQMAELAEQLHNVQLQYQINQEAIAIIGYEVREGNTHLQELLSLLDNLDANCAEIRQTGLLDELSQLSRLELISTAMQQQIEGLILYLRKTSEAGLLLDKDQNQLSNDIKFEGFANPMGSEEALNQGTLHSYIRLQQSIEAAITELQQAITQLEAASFTAPLPVIPAIIEGGQKTEEGGSEPAVIPDTDPAIQPEPEFIDTSGIPEEAPEAPPASEDEMESIDTEVNTVENN